MNTHNIDDAIPNQEKGSKTDTHHSITAESLDAARQLFHQAKERLQDVNHWHQLAGKASAIFKLTDNEGTEANRKVQKGDHFKINLPAPTNKAGGGHDWVVVEDIEDKSDPAGESEAFVIRVRPTQNPQKPDEDIAHFFKEDATSSFAVQRETRKVTASVHGRNEVPNTEADSIFDKARNAFVALGAMAGLSNPQWKSLVKGIVEATSTNEKGK